MNTMGGDGICGCTCPPPCTQMLCWTLAGKCGDKVVSATYSGPVSGSFARADNMSGSLYTCTESGSVYAAGFCGCVTVPVGTYTVTITYRSLDLSPCGGPAYTETTATQSVDVVECVGGTASFTSASPDPAAWVRICGATGSGYCCWVPPQVVVTFTGPDKVLGTYNGSPITLELQYTTAITMADCASGAEMSAYYRPASALSASGAYGVCYALGSNYYGDHGTYNTYEYATKCDRCSGIVYAGTPWVTKAYDGLDVEFRLCDGLLVPRVTFTQTMSTPNTCADLAPTQCSGPPEHPTGDTFTGKVCTGPKIPWCDEATSIAASLPGTCADAFCKCGMTPVGANPLPAEIHPLSGLPQSLTFDALTGTTCPMNLTQTITLTDRPCQTCYDLVYPQFTVTVTLP